MLGARAGRPAPAGGIFKSAAVEVLRRERRLMPTGEICRLALEWGLLACSGKTPEATMASALYGDIKRKDRKSIFIRRGRRGRRGGGRGRRAGGRGGRQPRAGRQAGGGTLLCRWTCRAPSGHRTPAPQSLPSPLLLGLPQAPGGDVWSAGVGGPGLPAPAARQLGDDGGEQARRRGAARRAGEAPQREGLGGGAWCCISLGAWTPK